MKGVKIQCMMIEENKSDKELFLLFLRSLTMYHQVGQRKLYYRLPGAAKLLSFFGNLGLKNFLFLQIDLNLYYFIVYIN